MHAIETSIFISILFYFNIQLHCLELFKFDFSMGAVRLTVLFCVILSCLVEKSDGNFLQAH